MEEQEITTRQNGAYEVSFLQRTEEGSAIKRLVTALGGTVLRERPITKVRLAYKVKKEPTAFFGITKFEMPGEHIRDLRAALRLEADVLRALVIHAKEGEEGQAAMQRSESGERRRPMKRVPGREVKSGFAPALSNEAIEKKIEEILQ